MRTHVGAVVVTVAHIFAHARDGLRAAVAEVGVAERDHAVRADADGVFRLSVPREAPAERDVVVPAPSKIYVDWKDWKDGIKRME